MRTTVFIFLLAAISCTNTPEPVSNVVTHYDSIAIPVTDTSLPVSVTSSLAHFLPGWIVCTEHDYAGSFWSFYDSNTKPYLAATDINDDGKTDFALFVKKHDSTQLVFLTSKENSFELHTIPESAKPFHQDLHYCLIPEPPGQVDVARPTIQSLILTSNGINLMDMENRKCIYYWHQDSIAVFKTM